eukprot:m.14156 g.14156  ORF g.14156 m.14156 type:complete len:993 (+) comp4760_c0_seq1:3-2981(+)
MLAIAMAALTVGQRADPLPLPGEQLAAHLAGASSIWHPVSEGQGASNFVWLRKNFTLPGGPEPTVGTVTVTATQSPLCRPPCEPHGGTSAPKLLGAYKLFINGVLVGMGPGRNLESASDPAGTISQAVDVIDVTRVLRTGQPNMIAVQCYNALAYRTVVAPRFLLQLDLSGAPFTIVTDTSWEALAADHIHNPQGSTGSYAQPHENLDATVYPADWDVPGGDGGSGWVAAALQPDFNIPLLRKTAEPLALLYRQAAAVIEMSPQPTPPPPTSGGLCGTVQEAEAAELSLACRAGSGLIKQVAFASWGTPSGTCEDGGLADNFTTASACNAPTSTAVVAKLCVGKNRCTVPANNAPFGVDPCHKVHKWLSVRIVCSNAPSHVSLTQTITANQTYNYLIDFGSEVQGGINLTVASPRSGVAITIKLGESLNPDGTVKVPMYTGNTFEDTWTLREGNQTLFQHEYMEFRWGEITGLPQPLSVADVGAWVVRAPLTNDLATRDLVGDPHSTPFQTLFGSGHTASNPPLWPVTKLAVIQSSDSTLNLVFNLTRYTVVTVGLDLNTDSNTRQRDLCHIDAYIAALGQWSVSNASGVQYSTAADALQPDSNIWASSADFKMVTPLLVQEMILATGEPGLKIAAKYFQQLKDFTLSHFIQPSGLLLKPKNAPCGFITPTPQGLACSLSNLIDWPSSTRDGYVDSPTSAVINAYAVGATEAVGNIAGWLNQTSDAEHFANISTSLANHMRSQLYDPSIGAFSDGLGINHSSVHASLFPAANGVVNVLSMQEAVTSFLNNTQTSQLKCSCMAAFWLLQGLYKMGLDYAPAADVAYRFLAADSPTSWVRMMREFNATATMEAWSPSEKPNLSFSHPWCAAPNSIIPRWILGVRPRSPAWATFDVYPQISGLEFVHAALPVARGTIDLTLTQQLAKMSLNLTVPNGSSASVCLPASAYADPTHGPAQFFVNGTMLPSAEIETRGRFLCGIKPFGAGVWTVYRIN